MANFLLWNVQRKPLDHWVVRLVEEHQIDVVLLVEYAGGSSITKSLTAQRFTPVQSQERFGVFSNGRVRLEPIRATVANNRACFWRSVGGSGTEGILVMVHGLDRRNYPKDDTRTAQFRQITDWVRYWEGKLGHKRTVIAGDFNANPFDPAMVSADGLHAIGVRSLRGRSDRMFNGTRTDFFYNPMWRHYGYGTDAGTATHYYHRSEAQELIWHMLDQVVVRPEALDSFPEDELRIVARVGEWPLTDPFGVPDQRAASDHLPIIFAWNL